MSEQPLERASVRAMIRWAKVVVREGDGKPSRAMRRAQGRILDALVRETAAPAQAANDASMVVLLGETGTSDRKQMLRLTNAAQAAQTVDRIVELLTPPDTDQSLDAACAAFRDYLEAGADQEQWPSYRALVRLQLAVWHHTGVDPSPAVKALVGTVAEDGPPEHPDAVVKAAVAACIEAAHGGLAPVGDPHEGVDSTRESAGLDTAGLDTIRARWPAYDATVDPPPDSEHPRRGDVIEPTPGLIAVAPVFADDLGDVLEHVGIEDAPRGVPCSKVHWRRANVQTMVEDYLVRTVMRCTCRQLGEPDPVTAECLACGSRDCPHGHELHYHHDGCPDCIREEETREPN